MGGLYGIKKIIIVCVLAVTGICVFPNNGEKVEYNYYYRYPVSFGISYQQLFMLNEPVDPAVKNYGFFLFDVSGNVRAPLNFFPYLQPAFKVGLTQALGNVQLEISGQTPDHDRFDHSQFHAALGLHAAYKFSKYLETGLFCYGGISYSIFPFMFPDDALDRFQIGILGEGGLSFSINPNYNISVDINSTLRYHQSIYGMLYDFDGWNLSISTTLNFRMGEDPDIIKGLYKSIQFEDIRIPAVFAALQNYYAEHPIGFIRITNTEKKQLTDVKISFYQADYMDSPTPVFTIPALEPGETCNVNLYAVYNSKILETAGMVPLTGEIQLYYNIANKPGKQTKSVIYNLYDKTALTWDDDKKIAAFITQADNIIKDYGSAVKQAMRNTVFPLLNEPLQTAIQIYYALQDMGCLYQADPLSPFSKVKEDKFAIDTVNLPRETLKRLTGDCDDLTVLYLSILGALGVDTGFVTTPGHIFPAININMPPDQYQEIYPDKNMFIEENGRLWIPVEITALGTDDFLKAWQTGINTYRDWDFNPDKRKFYISREAQSLYKPLMLKQRENGSTYAVNENTRQAFNGTIRKLAVLIVNAYKLKAETGGNGKSYNKLGSIYAIFNQDEEAKSAYNKALEIDPAYFYAKINLGDIYFKAKEFTAALDIYQQSREIMQRTGFALSNRYSRLLLRISIAHYMLDDMAGAREYYVKAGELAPDGIRQYSYLAGNFEYTTRGNKEEIFNLNTPYIEEED